MSSQISIHTRRRVPAGYPVRANPARHETVEHPFGAIKARMGATHFLIKTLPKVAAEMALSVLACVGQEVCVRAQTAIVGA